MTACTSGHHDLVFIWKHKMCLLYFDDGLPADELAKQNIK